MKLYVRGRGKWAIYYASDERGRYPLKSFVSGLEPKERNKLEKLFDRTLTERTPNNREKCHPVKNKPGIYELKSSGARVVFFYDENRVIVCSTGFKKGPDKLLEREADKCVEIRRRYLLAKQINQLSYEGSPNGD